MIDKCNELGILNVLFYITVFVLAIRTEKPCNVDFFSIVQVPRFVRKFIDLLQSYSQGSDAGWQLISLPFYAVRLRGI